MTVIRDLEALFRRDLASLLQQIAAFSSDAALWRTLPGIVNPAGNLVLHLEGNLREYICRQLGDIPYTRQRDLEFSAKGNTREDLASRIAELSRTLSLVFERLTPEQMEQPYPDKVMDGTATTQRFLIHLHGHLNWHLGQIDYLRRITAAAQP